MWLALIVVALVTYVDAIVNITQCPANCNCDVTSSGTRLYVDCRHGPRRVNLNKQQLSHQLDSLLSADHFVEHLTSLTITNSPLTRVPASVCKLVNLTSLNLNKNKLTELPDNCFTKLTKLVTLSMTRNSITRLQDGLFHGLQRLVNLDLNYNHIASIGLRVFSSSNTSDLSSFRSVDTNIGLYAKSLQFCWNYRCILGNQLSPVTISWRKNVTSNSTDKLHFDFQCVCV